MVNPITHLYVPNKKVYVSISINKFCVLNHKKSSIKIKYIKPKKIQKYISGENCHHHQHQARKPKKKYQKKYKKSPPPRPLPELKTKNPQKPKYLGHSTSGKGRKVIFFLKYFLFLNFIDRWYPYNFFHFDRCVKALGPFLYGL